MKPLIYQLPWMGVPPPPEREPWLDHRAYGDALHTGATKKNVSQRTRHKQKKALLSKTLHTENLLSYEVVQSSPLFLHQKLAVLFFINI